MRSSTTEDESCALLRSLSSWINSYSSKNPMIASSLFSGSFASLFTSFRLCHFPSFRSSKILSKVDNVLVAPLTIFK